MQCYQVKMEFTFIQGKSFLVSSIIKQVEAPPRLVSVAIPYYGSNPLKFSRFFETENEASNYVAHVQKVYANRTAPAAAVSGGQPELF